MNKRKSRLGLIEVALIVVVIGVLGATGWYALHTKHQTDRILSQADKISQEVPLKTAPAIKTFDQCQKAAGSITRESFPEVCMTKDGRQFTQ